MGRRTFVKGIGATAAGAFALGSDHGFTREAEAIAPLIGVGAIGAAATVGWALREFEVIGSDAPPEGLTAEVALQQSYTAARKRRSTNASTIVDNGNILDGVEHTAYTEAKIAAIEKLNEGVSEGEVLDAATAAINSYSETVIRNMLKSWNEAVAEYENIRSTLDAHSDTSAGDLFSAPSPDAEQGVSGRPVFQNYKAGSTTEYTFENGATITVREVGMAMRDTGTGGDSDWWWNPTGSRHGDSYSHFQEEDAHIRVTHDGNEVEYLDAADWIPLMDDAETTFQNVRDGMSTWVTNVYGDVQSGSIEISELVTPRERAAMMSDEEGSAQAIADLAALNISVDVEREATITFSDSGATLRGTFGLTDESDGPIEAGKTYDPTTFSGDVYFTTDTSLLEGDWSAYESGVDGGNITLTSEPYEGTAVEVTTAANETVAVNATDWTATGSGTWYYDAAEDLETTITEVTDARYRANTTSTNMETLNLKATFTVDKFENTETGEEADSASFESSEPQTDSNYITQEEWNSLEQQNQELIEKYEASQNNGGGLDLGALDMFGLPGEVVGVGIAAIVGFLALSD